VSGATYLCGGDETPGARGTDCSSALHDHPLPDGYVDASIAAGQRIGNGWSTKSPNRAHAGLGSRGFTAE
jgi:hypothetical protein